jgi:primosomal protein N' (replication factor Y) (superfamily II helicase)
MSELFPELRSASDYVRVVPELALDRMFDYQVPLSLQGQVKLGQRVRVPWGNRQVLAYVVDFPLRPEVEKCRDVLEIVAEEPLVPMILIKLARWMADYYCCDLALVLKGMLPDTVRAREDSFKKRLWVQPRGKVSAEEVSRLLKSAKAQQRAWQSVSESGGGWVAELSEKCDVSLAAWKALEEKNLVILSREKVERDPLKGLSTASQDLMLNADQKEALRVFEEESLHSQPRPILLQGVTGSGKTEVYLQMIRRVLASGKSALVLVPEIALTPQTVEQFRDRFESLQLRIAVLHSHLSAGERHDQWHLIREGKARVVIGARSAIFAPITQLGLIIIDEEHEASYKQEESPHYHARDLAVLRGSLEQVPVLLGTATPSLESYQNALSGKYRFVHLPKRVLDIKMPVIHVLDLRKEKVEKDQGVGVAQRLRSAVQERLAQKEQTILFLNRRGYATSLQCPKCGFVAECSHCAVPMTYHRSQHQLCCHLCDDKKSAPHACPECEFENYRLSGLGTQRIEDTISKIFSEATLCRMDSDSMRGKSAYQKALQDFREGRTEILVGTQMIAKGLHFPNVTCVGVINCDLALQLPDFRASERVFQQLVQVAGRAGRGEKPGEVFIQTYTPFHPAIQFARHHDVDGFLEQELDYRKAHGYPPFRRAALIKFRGRSEEKTKYCIEVAAQLLKDIAGKETEVPAPCPAPIPKIKDHYRFHLFLLTKNMPALSRTLKQHMMTRKWPEGVRMTIDIDPVNLM